MTVWHEWMSALFGPDMNIHVLGAITWADIALSCAVMVLIMIANVVAAIVIRRKRKATAPAGKLRHHTLGALRGPLYLLLWICGGYFALAPLVASSPLGTSMILGLLRILLNLGIFAVAFWFCFRFTRVLEARMSAWAAHTSGRLDDLLVPLLGRGLRVILPVLALTFAFPVLGLPLG